MASLITVRLDKGGSPSLGFRLQGGKDFGTPLVIQKVNGGSPAERAGLLAGDSVIKINTTDVFNLRHKDAQDVIIRAGPSFEVTVQRGGSTWKPAVIPTGPALPTSATVTKTSLAANKKDNIGSIGTGHNVAAKPFSPQLNGTVNGGPKVVNNQYNSPLKLYSEESIAETLSAQTEVLSTGVLGVNFKKNEKSYDATNSAVYRMLQEAEKEPRTPEPVSPRQVASPRSNTPLDDHSRLSGRLGNYPNTYNPNQEGVTKCTDCERVIVGVFVRIKDKNLHVECFKCSTCGSSLKNVGYYNINNKLYCDVHAKLAARSNPPAPNLVPLTAAPGAKAPVSAISSALASHSLPSPSPLSPRTNLAQPFQPSLDGTDSNLSTPLQNLNITPESNSKINNNVILNNSAPLSFSKFLNKAGNFSTTPKPFSSVTAPGPVQSFNTLPRAAPPAAAPLSPVVSAPAASFSPVSSLDRSINFVWPPQLEEPEVPTACPLYVPPPTHIKVILKPKQEEEDYELEEINTMADYLQPKMSLCSEEVYEITGRKSAVECLETLSETLRTQKLVDDIMKSRPRSPPPLNVDIAETTNHVEVKQTTECSLQQSSISSYERKDSSELKRLTDFKPNTVECKLKSQVENVVPQKWESPMLQALRTIPDTSDTFNQIPKKFSASPLASALVIAPPEPFNPQSYNILQSIPLPEETVPYFPPEHPVVVEKKEPKPDKPPSQFVKALQTAPERPFTPVGGAPVKKKKDPADEFFKDLPKPQGKLSMRDALTTASDRPYSPMITESVKLDEKVTTHHEHVEKKNLQKPLKPSVLPPSFQKSVPEKPQAPKPFPVVIHEKREEKELDVQTSSSKTTEKHKTQSTLEETVENIDSDRSEGMYPLFKGFSCSFANKSEHSQFKIEISTTPPIVHGDRSQTPSVKISRSGQSTESVTETISEETKKHEESKRIEKQSEQVVLKKPAPVSLALHKPDKLPQYQINISESAEADLQILDKMEAAKVRQQAQKVNVPPPPPPPRQPIQLKPVIKVQPGENNLSPEQSFKPVCEERPPSSTFSPRPRPITPSMINKPPPVLPYYQANLVAQQYKAAEINLLDPASPAISRSPSPYPEQRSQSPFPSRAKSPVRAKSPAAGPPPNPLRSNKPLPTSRDIKVEAAKRSLTTYIPQHQEKLTAMEQRQTVQTVAPQIYCANVETQSLQTRSLGAHVQESFREDKRREDVTKAQMFSQQTGGFSTSTAILEQSRADHLEQLKKSQSQSVQNSSDGSIQVQRKKTVTEEFEHTQKSKMIQIEKNVSTTKQGFRDAKVSGLEQQAILGMHLTNPQPIASPFLKPNASPSEPLPLPKPQQPPVKLCVQPPKLSPIKHVNSPSLSCPTKHVSAPSGSAKKPDQNINRSNIPVPNAGAGSTGGRQAGAIGVAPKRGRGVLNAASLAGSRVPLCGSCHSQIRGPFITALGKIWCPDHFICATPSCRRPLQDLGFVEEQGQLYCEYCFEQYLAPSCAKCNAKVKGDCLKAIGKNFHPECFTCFYCSKLFGNSPFFLEEGNPYCEADWNELFTTKCFACGFPVEAGDRWVEALNNNYHSQCFNCTMCKKNLEGQSFFAKGGRPFCKNHAR